MEKEFIPYEQSLALKELGFDKPCFRWYDERWGDDLQQDKYNTNKDLFMTDLDCSTPLYQQAFRWFREKYELVVDWNHRHHDNFGSYIGVCIKNIHLEETIVGVYKTPEEAELACLKKLIEIVKTK